MKVYYFTFRSVTLAQRGEGVLKGAGQHCTLARTPRWMEERGCGYCLRIRPADTLAAVERLRQAGAAFSKVYARTENGGVEELRV